MAVARKTAAEKQAEKQALLEAVDTLQQRFVELLLAGHSITEAARRLRIGRRTATYWMKEDSLVRYAYEHERLRLADEFRARVAKLHDLAMQTLEAALSPDAPLDVRLPIARFLYSAHLSQYAT